MHQMITQSFFSVCIIDPIKLINNLIMVQHKPKLDKQNMIRKIREKLKVKFSKISRFSNFSQISKYEKIMQQIYRSNFLSLCPYVSPSLSLPLYLSVSPSLSFLLCFSLVVSLFLSLYLYLYVVSLRITNRLVASWLPKFANMLNILYTDFTSTYLSARSIYKVKLYFSRPFSIELTIHDDH